MRTSTILTCVLGAAWSAPLVVMLALGPSRVEDNQPPPRWPGISDPIGSIARRFEVAFDRSFGLRPWLLASYSRVFVLGLGAPALSSSSATPSRQVLPGADGQLFYALDSIEAHRAATPWPSDVRAAWRDELSRRAAWFRVRGVRYVVVVAPDKQTIFDDALPRWARRVGEPWLDALYRDLAAAGVDAVDVRPSILAARRLARPYSRTDSHWNDFGACTAASTILASRSAPLPACAPVTTTIAPAGDQAALLGLAGVLTEEAIAPVSPALEHAAREVAGAPSGRAASDETGPVRLHGAVLAGDSFADALAPWLATGFASLARVPHDALDGAAALATRPAFVIDELVERKLAVPPARARLPSP